MKSGGGKAKGGQFERDVCKKLSLWLTKDENPNVLWRSAMSGGRATRQSKTGGINKAQSGDISAISEEGNLFINNFYVECKYYKDLGLGNFLTGDACKLLTFWKEAINNAHAHNKQAILIGKQNYKEEIILLEALSISSFRISASYIANALINPEGMSTLLVLKLKTFLEKFEFKSEK